MLNAKLKSTVAALGVLAMLAATENAGATNYYRYYQGGNFTAKLSYDGASVSVGEVMTRPLSSTGKIGSFAANVQNFYTGLQTDLNTAVAQEVAQTGAGTFYGGVLTGPINLGLSTQNGSLQVQFSGPTYSASASASGSKLGISYTCTSYVALNSISFSFLYNPINGQVQAPNPVNLNPTQSTSCSSSLDFIPVIGDFIDDWLAGKAGSVEIAAINNAAAKISGAASGGQLQLFALTSAIGPGQYVINGVDYGAYIVNNFSYLLSTSGAMNISIGAPANNSNYTDTGVTATLYSPIFTFNFTNQAHNFGFAVSESAYYTEKLACTGPNCPVLP